MLWGIFIIAFLAAFVACLFGWWKLFIVATMIWFVTLVIIRMLWDKRN